MSSRVLKSIGVYAANAAVSGSKNAGSEIHCGSNRNSTEVRIGEVSAETRSVDEAILDTISAPVWLIRAIC